MNKLDDLNFTELCLETMWNTTADIELAIEEESGIDTTSKLIYEHTMDIIEYMESYTGKKIPAKIKKDIKKIYSQIMEA